MKTLEEAREHLMANVDKGIHCDLCGRLSKVYKRNFNAGMSQSLIIIYKAFKANPKLDWLHVQDYFATQHGVIATAMDYIQLRHWGLIEAKIKTDEDSVHIKDPGLWRITKLGIDVAENRARIPKRVHLLNNKVINFDLATRSIEEALTKHFNYPELMNG